MKVSNIKKNKEYPSFIFFNQITTYKPESGCIQLKSSNYYSWYVYFYFYYIKIRFQLFLRLIFDGKDDTSYEPFAQSSVSYTFSNDDQHKVNIYLNNFLDYIIVIMQIDELRAWLLSFGDDETLNTELDFQFVLPEPKSFNDQSTQTNENEINDKNPTTTVRIRQNSESSDFFSFPDEDEPSKKRLHTDHD